MKVILLVLIFISISIKSNAGLINPFVSPINLNIGIDYMKPMLSNLTATNLQAPEQNLFKGENLNIYAGLRLFRFIGAETGYTNFNGNSFKNNGQIFDTKMNQTYIDAKLYMPIIDLQAFTAELYGSIGLANLSGSYYKTSTSFSENIDIKNATKIGGGIEFSILKTFSARVGYYQLNKQIPTLENNKFSAYYGGFSIYLI